MHQNTPYPLLRAALDATECGWHVFPLVPGAKRPAVRSWERRATLDVDRVTVCWAAAACNVGVAAGPSGLVVVDLDVPKHDEDLPPAGTSAYVNDGVDALAALAERHGERLPARTFTVRTAGGGKHLYFVAPSGIELRNTAGTLGWKIDTRAHGGYVVGAGSSIGTKAYAVVDDAPPALLPQWLATLLAPQPLPLQEPVTISLPGDRRREGYLRAAVDAERARVENAQEGNRNNALYQASVALGQLVAGQELDPSDVTDWLVAAAMRNGLTDMDARRTVNSGLRAGAQKPRSIRRRAA